MKQLSKEKILDTAEQIIKAFQKNKSAGYIALSSLDHLDRDTKAYIRYRISCFDERLPEDLRNYIFERTGRLFVPHRKRIEKNLPVKKLIELFNDKKSGMVGAAATQLKERFLYLEYKDQIKVMNLFLASSVSYREWCYRTLIAWREPKYDETLLDHWHKYADNDCLYTIIAILPESAVKEIYLQTRPYLHKYYRLLLERFGTEPWVDIDKDYLKEHSSHLYYYIKTMSNTHMQLSASECAKLFYNYLRDSFSPCSTEDLWELNKRFVDSNNNTPPLCYHLEEIRLESPNKRSFCVSEFLELFARMGHYDLVTGICSWGESMNRNLPRVDTVKDDDTDSGSNRAICKERFLTYVRLLWMNMPKDFDGIFDTPACDIDTVASELESEDLLSDPAISLLTERLDLVPF